MGASYWARWACNGQVSDIADLVLPHVLTEGYELLAVDDDRQMFDRGGVMKKIGWSLNGGRWQEAPVDLTIRYSCSPTRTTADFHWSLAVRPLPSTPKEQASFEAYLQRQMNRIIAELNEQLAPVPVAEDQEAAEEGAGLQACWESAWETLQELSFAPVADPVGTCERPAGSTVSTVAERTKVHRCGTHLDGAPQCDLCHRPAVPVPGTNGRYYCLICRQHLPYRPAV